jgi:hypothetical protein
MIRKTADGSSSKQHAETMRTTPQAVAVVGAIQNTE